MAWNKEGFTEEELLEILREALEEDGPQLIKININGKKITRINRKELK